MALADAIEAVHRDWANVTARFGLPELEELNERAAAADTLGAWRLIAHVLPADHPAWAALDRMPTRRSTQESTAQSDALSHLLEQIEAAIERRGRSVGRADVIEKEAKSALLALVMAAGVRDPLPDGALVVTDEDGQAVAPAFQFTQGASRQLRAVVVQANETLDANADPWGALSWWTRPNRWLGAAPADLLGTPREPEVPSAAAQTLDDSW